MITLADFLKWVLAGGAGAVAYFLMERVPVLMRLEAEWKRYAALAISAGLACLGFLASVAMGYELQPVDVQAWIESLFAVVAVAVGLSQIIHARLRLSAH